MSGAKRIIIMAIAIAFLQTGFAQTPNTAWFNMDDLTFTISSADELAGLAQIVNGTWGGTPARHNFSGKTVTLSKDINLSTYGATNAEFNGGKGWIPIGRSSTSFRGIFDGGSHKISEMFIDSTGESYRGLFGYVEDGGVIKNVGLENINILTSTWTTSGDYIENIGGIAGYLTGSSTIVENCYVTGTIGANNSHSVGLIAGYLKDAVVRNCYSAGTVIGSGAVGGIAGYIFSGSLRNCYSIAEVIGSRDIDTGYVGGIVGRIMSSGTVANNAALNLRVVNGSTAVGRVAGSSTTNALSNNAAFVNLMNISNTSVWSNKGLTAIDGEDISLNDIMVGATLGDRFTMGEGSPWTTGQFRLPGLFGETVPLPAHLTTNPYVVLVTISPAEFPWIDLGQTKEFTASVVGMNNAATTVTWSIVGKVAAGTSISNAGLLTISNSETNSRFTVRATSTADPSRYASVTVNVRVPYKIGTAAELAAFADTINSGIDFTGRLVVLTSNIDLSVYSAKNTAFNSGKGWIPIGRDATPFRGEFDGYGYVVHNLYINDNINDAGLFGVIGKSSSSGSAIGLVKNIGLENVSIYTRGSATVHNAGGVAGKILGYGSNDIGDFTSTIMNSYVTGTVTGINNVGGITGFVDGWGLVQNSYTTAEITASGTRMGGITGEIKGAIQNCAALNTRVSGSAAGRISAERTNTYASYSNNVGFVDMLNSAGNNTWSNKGLTSRDGADISAIAINEPGTIGGRFTIAGNWTTMPGRLPGFRGTTLAMPEHLIVYSDAVVPQITQQPLGAAIAVNEPYTMSIEANAPDGGILSYQWYMNTSPSNIGGTAITGETSASYDITIPVTGTYYYYVTVKNTMPGYNRTASVTSTLVALVVGGGDGQDPIVVNVTVSPSQIPVADVGKIYTFTANVIGINDPVTTVIWIIVGNKDEGTSVSQTGVLTVSENETNESFFVLAFSLANPNMRDSALVKVRVPYKIGTAAQLRDFADSINSGSDFSGRLVILTADIDLSVYGASNTGFNGGKGWVPIGLNAARPFRGEFDGRGHVVRGLYINDAALEYAGLFGRVGTTPAVTGVGTISNIGLEDANITAKGYVGGIVGAIRGYGTYVGTINQRDFNSNLKNCYVTGTIASNNYNYTGGIAGIVESWGGVSNCYTTAEVTGTGGIAGYLNEGEISNCVALNPSVKREIVLITGRITGSTSANYFMLNNNVAFANMLNSSGFDDWNNKGLNTIDGADITANDINADGTLGERFTVADGWTIQNGRLPGFGNTLAIPSYIEDKVTSIRAPQIARSQISVKAVSGAIVLENLPQNARVEVYNLKGKRLHSNNPENLKILRIMVQTKGIYIVKINAAAYRVVVR